MFAAAKGVDNLIATVDLNGKQIDGSTNEVLHLGSVKEKFEAFGWVVLELDEGNTLEKIISALKEAKSKLGKSKPVAILMKTEMGNGVSFMMHTHAWHGKAPNDDQLETALSENKETLGDY
jgi:transketolase